VTRQFADVDEAVAFVRAQVTTAAQGVFPFGAVVVIREAHEDGDSVMMAIAADKNRPYDHVAAARDGAAQLSALGWQVTSDTDPDVEYLRAELGGCLVEVFCKRDDDVTVWLGRPPRL
jgi:hypothetical protein